MQTQPVSRTSVSATPASSAVPSRPSLEIKRTLPPNLITTPLPVMQEPSKLEQKGIDYSALKQALGAIEDTYKIRLKELTEKKQQLDLDLKKVQIIKNEKLYKLALNEASKKAEELNKKVQQAETELEQSKKRTQLHQQKFLELQQQESKENFSGTVDEKLTWIIKREALQQLETKNNIEAQLRKNPLQQSTLAGRTKELRALESRITQAMSIMEDEQKQLKGQQTKLEGEKKELSGSLTKRNSELTTLLGEEKQEQTKADTCKNNLNEHQKTTNAKSTAYNDQRAQQASNLAAARNDLTNLENQRANYEADIRQSNLTIQQLEKQTRKIIMQPTWILKKWDTWHGYVPFIGGWRHHEAWVIENVPKEVDDTDVINRLNHLRAHVHAQRIHLNNVYTAISTKQTQIAGLEKGLVDLDQTWENTKNELNKQLWSLEETKRQADGRVFDANAKKLQKENEIKHLNESIAKRISEITQTTATLKDRQASTAVFQADLSQCQNSIIQLQSSIGKNAEAAAKLKNTPEIKHNVATQGQVQLMKERANAKILLDTAKLEETAMENKTVSLKSELTIANENLRELTHPQENSIAAKRQQQTLSIQMQMETVNNQINKVQEERDNLKQTILLGQGLVPSGHQQSENAFDNVITCLLQGVFSSQQLYHLNSAANMPLPGNWKNLVEKIKTKFSKNNELKNQNLTSDHIIELVKIVNSEFQFDKDIPVLRVKLFGRDLPNQALDGKKYITLNLWQDKQRCLLLSAEKEQANLGNAIRIQRLLGNLRSPNKLFTDLCVSMIRRDCEKPLTECAAERLANYCREEVQFDLKKLTDENSKKRIFHAWFDKLFAKVPVSNTPSADAKNINIQALQYCLNTLKELYPTLSETKQHEILTFCHQQYLTELKAVIASELNRRAENDDNAKRAVDENKAALANKIQSLAGEMKKQQDTISKLETDILSKKQALSQRQQQTQQLKQHYEQQSAEVEFKIQEFVKIKNQVADELAKLQKGSGNEQRIKELESKRKEMAKQVTDMEAERSQLKAKLGEVEAAQEKIEQEKIKVDSDQQKYLAQAKDCKISQDREEEKIKFISNWRDFLKTVHTRLLNDKDAFVQRRQILAKFDAKDAKAATLKNYYKLLIDNIACLKNLNDPTREAEKEEFKAMVTSWPHDLRQVLEDVLGSPQIQFRIDASVTKEEAKSNITDEELKKEQELKEIDKRLITIKGNNISWVDAISEIKKEVIKKLEKFGFTINDQNKLVLSKAALVGSINQLPERLKKLLMRHVEVHYAHYTIANENRVDQTPRWKKSEEHLSTEQLNELLSKADISFSEVLHVYADTIELTAAHNLYLDEHIHLPGINVTFYSKEQIHCIDDLVINTTPRQLDQLKIAKAVNGDDYAKATRRGGDDGLDGQAGECAGHIVMKAENAINNLVKIKFIANGANGLNGQRAGDGGSGHKGVDMPDAETDLDTSGATKAQYILVQGRTPGMNSKGVFTPELAHEKSGPGADAGKAGLGGGAGLSGDVVVQDAKHTAQLLASTNKYEGDAASLLQPHAEQKSGKQGQDAESDAKGGLGGEPGAIGMDLLLNKRSFFKWTEKTRGKFEQRGFDHSTDYHQPDEACGFSLGVLSNHHFVQEGNNRYQKLIMAIGCSTNIGMEVDEKTYRNNPRSDEHSRGERGRNNNESDMKKNPANRRQTQQTQTVQHQLGQIKRIAQTAASIHQNHVITKHDNKYEAEIASYRGESEKLGQQIQQCTEQATVCGNRSAQLKTQFDQNTQVITELQQKLQQINQLIKNANNSINANDQEQLQNLRELVQRNCDLLQAQTELACANIDVDSKKNVKQQLSELHLATKNALQLLINTISQDIRATEAIRLQHAERLSTMQQEFALLEQALNDGSQQNSQANKLRRLANELAHIEQRQQQSQVSQQIILLADGKKADSKDDKESSLARKPTLHAKFFFNLPTAQEQCDEIVLTFKSMFPKSVTTIKQLEKAADKIETESVWKITLNGLQAELKTLRDLEQPKESLERLKYLFNYCENIFKTSNCTLTGLTEIYSQLLPLAQSLKSLDQKHQGESILALRNLSEVLEERCIELLTTECIAESVGKDKEQQKQLISEQLQKALITCSESNPPLAFEDQLSCKLNLLIGFIEAIKACIEHKQADFNKPFAELMQVVFANVNHSFPSVENEKNDLFTEARELLKSFKIAVPGHTNLQIKNRYAQSCFTQLKLHIEFLFVRTVKAVEALQAKEIKDIKEFKNRPQKILTILQQGKKQALDLIESLTSVKSSYAKLLLQQLIKNHQILAVMIDQSRLTVADDKQIKDPVLRCKQVINLYEETLKYLAKVIPGERKESTHAARESVKHFIRTTPLAAHEWQAILMHNSNSELLKKYQTLLLPLLVEQICSSNKIDFILASYQRCQFLLGGDSAVKNKFKLKLEMRWRSTIQIQLESIQERLLNGSITSENQAIVQDMIKQLQLLSSLWCSPTQSLVPLKSSFDSLQLINTLTVSKDSLKKLREITTSHLLEQKQSLIKEYKNGNKAVDKQQPSLAILIRSVIKRIPDTLKIEDQKVQTTKYEEIINDLDKCMLTINLLLKNQQVLLDNSELEEIEKSFYFLQQILIMHRPINSDKQAQLAFWSLLQDRSYQVKNLLNNYYLMQVSNKFTQLGLQNTQSREPIKKLLEGITAHYDSCVESKASLKQQQTPLEDKKLITKEIKPGNKTNSYFICQRYFIELLLKKIEHTCLSADEEKNTSNITLLQNHLTLIKQHVVSFGSQQEDSIAKIEFHLINKVNEQGLKSLKSQKLFTSIPQTEFKPALPNISTSQTFSSAFTNWLTTVKTVFSSLGKIKDTAWLTEFINDSVRFLHLFVLETEAQEKLLMELELTLQNYLLSLPQDKANLSGAVKQLIQVMNYSCYRTNNYLYANRLLEMQNQDDPTLQADAHLEEIEVQTLQHVEKTFAEIQYDLGATINKAGFINKLPNLLPLHNKKQSQKIIDNIVEINNSVSTDLMLLPANRRDSKLEMKIESKVESKDGINLKQQKIIQQLNSINTTELLNIAILRKIFLMLRNLPETALQETKKFIIGFVNNQQSKSQEMSAEQTYYCNQIGSQLAKSKAGGSIMLGILLDSDSKASQPYKEFINSLTKKEFTWKVPYLIDLLPLLTPQQFSKDNYEEIIPKLINGDFALPVQQRIALLQVLIQSYSQNCIIPTLSKDSSKDELVKRAVAYCNKYLESCLQSNNRNPSRPSIGLRELNSYFQFIKNSAAKIQNIEVKTLLTPAETELYTRIVKNNPEMRVDEILVKQESNIWDKTLREIYFDTFTTALANNAQLNLEEKHSFHDLFTNAYIAAQKENEMVWLQCLDELLKNLQQTRIKFSHVQAVLQSVAAIGSIGHVEQYIKQKMHPLLLVKECAFAECVYAIQKCTEADEKQQELLDQFYDLKSVIFNSDESGIQFLQKFGQALIHYNEIDKVRLYPLYLQELLQLVKKTQAYKHEHLLSDKDKMLDVKNIMQWNYQLKREKYVQLFGLQEAGISKEIDTLAHYLNRIEKNTSADLMERLVTVIKSKIQYFMDPKDFNSFDINRLNGFLVNFANNYWELDESCLIELGKLNVEIWHQTLQESADRRFAKVVEGDRSSKVVVQEMLKEVGGINSSIRQLLEADPGQSSHIEKQINAAQAKYQEYRNWSESDIKKWINNFRPIAMQAFNDQVKIVEFAAILMRASKIKLNKEPRPVQLAALLLFIDAIQKGKGRLANISTGEGKSLITMMTAIVLALRGERVDIVTSNEVLAERDAKGAEALLSIFDIKVSNNCDQACEKSEDLRRERYNNCQIIYGTTGSFQRDLLLTNFFGKNIRGLPGQAKPGNVLLIDEVDSMFIDNAEKILYISHSIQDLRHLNDLFVTIWAAVNSGERAQGTEDNIKAIAEYLRQRMADKNIVLPNTLESFIQRRLEIWIKSAYMAKYMEENKEYTIPKSGEKHGKAVVMDLDTGVEQTTTQWSNGLHQFIQLKHMQKLSEESLKAVFMANIVFFQSYHQRIIGMTGTLGSKTELDLMSNPKIYGVDFFRLPRNKPERYQQEESLVVSPLDEKGQLIGARENWRLAIVKDVSDKQCQKGSHDKKAIDQANIDLKNATEQLAKLEKDKIEQEARLNKAMTEVKALKIELENIDTILKRDAVVDTVTDLKDQKTVSPSLMSRDQLLKNQTVLTDKLKQAENNVTVRKMELDNTLFGNNSIDFNRNKKRNAEFVLDNHGARPVLIICANIKDVNDLEESFCADVVLGNRNITNIITLKSKDDKLPEALGPHDIVIATNIAGRGTDLETLDIVDKNGGLHVILGYVPPNVRIETQAFRRTARNGKRGSGKFIVCSAELEKNPDLNITVDLLREIRDIEEARRIDRIRIHGIPKLEREQALFVKFIELQRLVRERLESSLKEPKDYDKKWLETQIKSLQNKWAFFLDEMDAKVSDIENVSELELDIAYQGFANDVWKSLDKIPFRLITEPAELLKMARYSLDPKISKHHSTKDSYRLAEEYLDAIIEKDPKFASMAYYYKAICNFGRNRNSLEDKQAARRSLKKAIDLFDERIGHLSSAAQSLRYIRDRKRDAGQGTSVDEFSQTIAREISLIQIHMNAAREALGTELNAESLKSGTVTGTEHEVIFENIRKHLGSKMKDYRVSKKVTIKEVKSERGEQKELYRNGELIKIPHTFAAARDQIIKILAEKVADVQKLEKRSLMPNAFKELFITKQQFLTAMGDACKKQKAVNLHADIQRNVDAKGLWDTGAFSDCKADVSQKIKQLIMGLDKTINEEELVTKITEQGVNAPQARSILTELQQKSILEINDTYLLNSALHDKIKAYLKNNSENNATSTSLLQQLNLQAAFPNSAHHQDVESELLHLYRSSVNKTPAEILLTDDASKRYTQLWSYLKSVKVVKDPTVNFKLTTNPEKELDDLKDLIKLKLNELIAGKDEKDREKYVKSIYGTLEKAIGKIKQFEKLKVDPKTLQDFLQGGRVPPEIVDFTNQCYDIVISLPEDKGFHWGVIAVAIMGIVQIAAGVIIGALSFGTAAYISAVLISEGISDIMFAVQSGISGNFSWAAYGEHKWQSLLISLATAGLAFGVGGAATAAKTALTFGSIVKQIAIELGKAGLAIALSTATDQLVKQVLASILNDLDKDFENWVRSSATYQAAEGRLEEWIGKIHEKFGADEASRIITQVMGENSQERGDNFVNIFHAKLSETIQKLSSHMSLVSGSGNTTATVIKNILAVASHVAKAADVVMKFHEIAGMTSQTLTLLERSLERAYNKNTDEQARAARPALTAKEKKDFSQKILSDQTKIIIGEVKQFIKQNIMKPGTQALLQMAAQPLNDLLQEEAMKELKAVETRVQAEAEAEAAADREPAAVAEDKTTQTITPAPHPKKQAHSTHRDRKPSSISGPSSKKAATFAEKTKQSARELLEGAKDAAVKFISSTTDFVVDTGLLMASTDPQLIDAGFDFDTPRVQLARDRMHQRMQSISDAADFVMDAGLLMTANDPQLIDAGFDFNTPRFQLAHDRMYQRGQSISDGVMQFYQNVQNPDTRWYTLGHAGMNAGLTYATGSLLSKGTSLATSRYNLFSKATIHPSHLPSNQVNALKLNTQLKLMEDGILGLDGKLTQKGIENAKKIPIEGLTNKTVISELQKQKGHVSEWNKMRTKTVDLSSGQPIEVHFYQHKLGDVNYTHPDYKAKFRSHTNYTRDAETTKSNVLNRYKDPMSTPQGMIGEEYRRRGIIKRP